MAVQWRLNIRVLDQAANSKELAAVTIISAPTSIADIAALTGSDGQVSVAVPSAGEYQVMVVAEGHTATNNTIAAVADNSVSEIVLDP